MALECMGNDYAVRYKRTRKEQKELEKAFADDSVSEEEDSDE